MAVRGRARETEEHNEQTVSQIANEHVEQTFQGMTEGVGGNNSESVVNGGGGGGGTDQGATTGRTEEEKRASFSRLASIRTSNALDAMRGLGHLANTTSYAFDKEQIDKMLGALQASLDALRKNFAKALEPKPPKIPGQRQKRGERNLSFRL